ncbi:glycosyltransferase family 4 protein, partial [Candidatus Pacearchaeota archaeon]|nr:glycosyltransferase family 4 protein [Candidatus Pacearchaeota archaeon]
MNWYPFEGSATPLFASILRHLKNQGHEITIFTSIPYFMNGRAEQWTNYKGKFFVTEYWEDIKVKRVFVLSPYFMRRRRLGIRFVNFLSYAVNSLIAGLLLSRHDVILTVSHPPLLIGMNSWIISRIKGCKYIYCLQDIYPDILHGLKILRKGWMYSLMRMLELFVYNKSAAICVLSSAMSENLVNKKVPMEKIHIVPHFSDADKIVPLPKINDFSKGAGLDLKFVVLLPGSVSYRYGIDTIFECAKNLRDNADIVFVFIDRGELREDLKQKVKGENMGNVHFLPFQPADKFGSVLASADVCLVPLDGSFASYSVPSKLYNIMQSARPAVAISDEKSEVAKIIKEAGCGMVVP